jgi:transcriptional regulator with XRE-family HTH domain
MSVHRYPHVARAFGDALRQAREAAGYTQAELEEITGYAARYVTKLERGKQTPTLGVLFTLAAALNIEPAALVRETQAGVSFGPMPKKSAEPKETEALAKMREVMRRMLATPPTPHVAPQRKTRRAARKAK